MSPAAGGVGTGMMGASSDVVESGAHTVAGQDGFASLGGMEEAKEVLWDSVVLPLTRPDLFARYALKPPRGVLLHGPPGSGKTSLARAVSEEAGATLFIVNGPEIMSEYLGESEQKLVDVFKAAKEAQPSLVFIDELDAIAPARTEDSEDISHRIVATLLTILEGGEGSPLAPSVPTIETTPGKAKGSSADPGSAAKSSRARPQKSPSPARPEARGIRGEQQASWEPRAAGGQALAPSAAPQAPAVMVLAATNRVNAVDPALRRPGRFDREIEIGVPSPEARQSMLTHMLEGMQHSLSGVHVAELAATTHGYVAADLRALCSEAALECLRRHVAARQAGHRVQSELPMGSLPGLRSGDRGEEGPARHAMRNGAGEATDTAADVRQGGQSCAAAEHNGFVKAQLSGAGRGNGAEGTVEANYAGASSGTSSSAQSDTLETSRGNSRAGTAGSADGREPSVSILPSNKAGLWQESGGALGGLAATWADFTAAKLRVRASAMREVALEVPRVRWADIGGNQGAKQALREAVEWPQRHSEALKRIGATPPKGLLLYGPPGCSKTLLAKAVASEARLNFLSVKGPELLSKFVGESEKAVRALFAKARQCAPSVVFFDEIDGLVTSRGARDDSTRVGDRVLSQLLTELDGLSPLLNVTIIGATNRPDLLDSALLRPGRFDRLVYVGPPATAEERAEVFRICLRSSPCAPDVDALALARACPGYTGADVAAICREAALAALEESIHAVEIKAGHFDQALRTVKRSLSSVSEDVYRSFSRLVDQ